MNAQLWEVAPCNCGDAGCRSVFIEPAVISMQGALSAENGRRIVACVNALSGLPTDMLEAYGINAAAANEHRIRLLMDERDALLKQNARIIVLAAGFMPESNYAMFADAASAILAGVR